jgi:uncharacterized Ntn-hydrolase superfamily protein
MTFSIVAHDAATGDLGVAVASRFLAVGSAVPWARAGVGAVATQAWANVEYGPAGLVMLAAGATPDEAVARLTGDDPGRVERQLGIVDATGRAATYTGERCITWAGGRTGDGVAVQGNILTGPEVVDAMLAAFEAAPGPLPDRLLAALVAGDAAGGDRRGRESAALLVVRAAGGYGGGNDRWIDLRVDDHVDPVTELARLRALSRLYNERPDPADLVEIDPTLATELRTRLAAAGWAPGREDAFTTSIRSSMVETPRLGTPRRGPGAWTAEWDAALLVWMGVANLEERAAAMGWIDPAVLAELRAATEG